MTTTIDKENDIVGRLGLYNRQGVKPHLIETVRIAMAEIKLLREEINKLKNNT